MTVPLRHRFQQRRLRLGRGAVDLVRQHQVGEDRARLKRELPAALRWSSSRMLVPVMSAGIRSGVNWMRLNCEVERFGQRPHQHRLAQAGHAFQQRVAAADQADQHVAHDVRLADHDRADFFLDPGHDLAELETGMGGAPGAVGVSMAVMGVPFRLAPGCDGRCRRQADYIKTNDDSDCDQEHERDQPGPRP